MNISVLSLLALPTRAIQLKSDNSDNHLQLEHLGLADEYKGTLADEMVRYQEGTLVLLQPLLENNPQQRARGAMFLNFTGGSQYCGQLLQEFGENFCSARYKDSLSKVLVVGEELRRWEDDAYYFSMKITGIFSKRELIVHGRDSASPAVSVAPSRFQRCLNWIRSMAYKYVGRARVDKALAWLSGSESTGSWEQCAALDDAREPEAARPAPGQPDGFRPEILYVGYGDRLQISPALTAAPAEQKNAAGRFMAYKFFEKLLKVIKSGLLATDWTPCASYGGGYVTLLPTAHFVSIHSIDSNVNVSASLERMRQAIDDAFGQQADVKKLLDAFEQKDQVTKADARELLDDLFALANDWDTRPEE